MTVLAAIAHAGGTAVSVVLAVIIAAVCALVAFLLGRFAFPAYAQVAALLTFVLVLLLLLFL